LKKCRFTKWRVSTRHFNLTELQIVFNIQHHGANELGHLEIVATIIHQLTRDLAIDEIKASGFDKYYTDHTIGIWPQAAGGVPFNACEFQCKGDPITDLFEDMAAEQKARSTYDNILRLCRDYPDVYEPIKFLRAREIVHFQRFGESLGIVRENMDTKNFYAFNSAFDTSAPCADKCNQ
jgi:spore coat protein JC